jgi:hypothetical protein
MGWAGAYDRMAFIRRNLIPHAGQITQDDDLDLTAEEQAFRDEVRGFRDKDLPAPTRQMR